MNDIAVTDSLPGTTYWWMFSVSLKHCRCAPSSLRCPASRGQGFELLLRRAGSHSITYLCDNITEEKPSKQPSRPTKPAASTAKRSLGVIVFQFLVATIVCVHISFFSHTYATCCTFTSVVIYCWSTGTSVCALSLSYFGDVSQFHVCK